MNKFAKNAKKTLDFILSLLALARWLPLPGQWRSLVIALSAMLGTVSGLLVKCDQTDTHTPSTEPLPAQTSTPIHTTPSPTPSPKPTVRPPRIMIDRAIVAKHPFTVRYTAPFQYNTHLWADKYRLGYLGKDVDGGHVLYAVVLNTPGKRKLTVRNEAGDVLASEVIEVNP